MKYYLRYGLIAMFALIYIKGNAQQFSTESVIPLLNVDRSERVHIAPNPVHGSSFFYIQIDSCIANNMDSIIIYNSTGFVIQSKQLRMLTNGDNRFLINISGFEPGTYIIRLVGRDVPLYSFSAQILVDI